MSDFIFSIPRLFTNDITKYITPPGRFKTSSGKVDTFTICGPLPKRKSATSYARLQVIFVSLDDIVAESSEITRSIENDAPFFL
mmetsp:Transcript_23971/g.49041  ORF Transcript_23971/g.49041 Transcript_23971/m.49041 type:complete len:84 (-) Transcript_23971:434-685(-)